MPPRPVSGPTAPTASKIVKKERIVQALSRMNDRDTQKAAAEDLLSLVLNVDQECLPILVSCLCTTGSEHKVFARKECSRAIGVIASEACPLREQALQQPHFGKMLGQLRKSLQDPDSGVREASSEALALVAQGLAQLETSGPQGNLTNPVVKLIFDCLAEQKKELNAAACAALGLAAPYLGTLDASLSKELVRKLNSPSFQAVPTLLGALARSDPVTGEPVGLMKSGPAAFIPVLSALVGQPAPQSVGSSTGTIGSGVAGALSRPDWPVRQAAADMLRSTALLLGPLMELDGCWTRSDPKSISGRAIRALESCKFDKVRDVRDVARNALAVLEALHEYGSGGGSAAGWPAHIATKVNGQDLHLPVATSTFVLPAYAGDAAVPGLLVGGRKSPGRRSAVSPTRRPRSALPQSRSTNSPPAARVPAPPERRSSPMLARGGSVSERFRAAHRGGDVVSVHYLGGVESEPLPGSANSGTDAGLAQPSEAELVEPVVARASIHDGAPPEAQPSSRRVSRQQSKASDNSRAGDRPAPVERLPAGALAVAGPDELLRNLALEDDAVALLGYDEMPTFSEHVIEPPSAAEIAAWAAPDPVGHVRDTLSEATTSAPAPAPVAWPTLPPVDEKPSSVTVPVEEWLAAQQRLRSLEEQHRKLLETFSSMSEQNRQTIAGLEAKVSGLQTALQTAQSQAAVQQQELEQLQRRTQDESPVEAEVSWMSRTIRPGSPLMVPTLSTTTANITAEQDRAAAPPELPPAGSGPGSTEVRQAYREVLAMGRVSDMHLLRLMQRTGPIWSELGPDLSEQLLAAFIANLQQARADGPMLSRMMPWLWRLADEQNTVFEAPVEMRAALVDALLTAQASVTDSLFNDRISLLVSTFRTHWSLPDASPATVGRRFLNPNFQQQPVYDIQQPQLGNFSSSTAAFQEISLGAGFGLPKPSDADAVTRGLAAPPAIPSAPAAVPLAPADSQSPVVEPAAVPYVTPRVAAIRSSQAARSSPSMGTLMGQWSDLQRDFAAMASPSNRPMSRGQG